MFGSARSDARSLVTLWRRSGAALVRPGQHRSPVELYGVCTVAALLPGIGSGVVLETDAVLLG
jgi:hypothetical protein